MKNTSVPIFSGYHSTRYNQIVEPQKIWSCSKYFLRRWAPILDANRFWTVIAARNLAYYNDHKSTFETYDRRIAKESALSMRQVSRLKSEMLEETALSVFLKRKPTKLARSGEVVRSEKTFYSIRLDTPLTPGDALEVSQWLNTLKASKNSRINDQINLVLDSGDPSLLIPTVTPKLDKHLVAWQGYTVSDLLKHAGLSPYQQQGDLLHQLLTGSTFISTQYFRHSWVPLLGHGPAYLASWLRSYCYADASETRNELTFEKKILAQNLHTDLLE